MSTANCRMRTPGAWQPSRILSGVAAKGRGQLTAMFRRMATRVRETEAAELLEFALALPLILVMVVGLLDFSHAYSIKQKLANAAREGARIGGSEDYKDITNPNCSSNTVPCSIETIKDDVTTYLTDAGINTNFIGTTASYDLSTYTATYYTTGGGGASYGLKIERDVQLTYQNPSNSTTVLLPSTRVTLYYPYDWTFGFDQVIKLLMPSSTFTDPIRIETDAMMANP